MNRLPIPDNVMVELSAFDDKLCTLCNHKELSEKLYGKLYQLNGIAVHYFCILLSSGATQNGLEHQGIWGFLLQDIISELQRGAQETCCYCNKNGATISCRESKCQKVFHLPCGLKNGSMHHYFVPFKSFCGQHRIAQNVDLEVSYYRPLVKCTICKDDIMPAPSPSTLWAPCCRHNAWFHRDCAQELALSAGYLFKCPLCNSYEQFRSRMLLQGIYIPSRNASWEIVSDAEMLDGTNTCNALYCLCPYQEKRNYNDENGSWQIIQCYLCGSNGTHKVCNSNVCDQGWRCPECQANPERMNRRNRLNQIVQNHQINRMNRINQVNRVNRIIRMNHLNWRNHVNLRNQWDWRIQRNTISSGRPDVHFPEISGTGGLSMLFEPIAAQRMCVEDLNNSRPNIQTIDSERETRNESNTLCLTSVNSEIPQPTVNEPPMQLPRIVNYRSISTSEMHGNNVLPNSLSANRSNDSTSDNEIDD